MWGICYGSVVFGRAFRSLPRTCCVTPACPQNDFSCQAGRTCTFSAFWAFLLAIYFITTSIWRSNQINSFYRSRKIAGNYIDSFYGSREIAGNQMKSLYWNSPYSKLRLSVTLFKQLLELKMNLLFGIKRNFRWRYWEDNLSEIFAKLSISIY